MARVVPALLSSFTAIGLALPAAAVPASAAQGAAATASMLTVVPAPGTTLTLDGRPYAGDLVVAPDAGGVDVVNRVGFEQYVEGIGEMPSNWPPAALQAQAIAARTYALWTVLTHPAGPGGGQICATDSCQVYSGLDKAEGPYGANWVSAVRATQGMVLQYGGRIIEALYGSSDGGQTLYGGVPWLPSVADPQDSMAPEHQWSWSASLAQMAGILGVPAGHALVSLVSSSQAITETLRTADGSTSSAALTPDEFHTVVNTKMPDPPGLDLPLPSYRYSVSTYGDTVKIAGWGDGNGLGLSQYGALGKALAGWSAGQILANYYAGTVPAALPTGEMPATISVTLASRIASSTIGASGPVRILDASGRTLVTTTGPGGWGAQAEGQGVAMAPTTSIPVAAPPVADTAPIPQRAPAPGAGGSAAAPGSTASGAGTPASTDPSAPTGRSGVATAALQSRPPVSLRERAAVMAVTPRSESRRGTLAWALLAGVVLAGVAAMLAKTVLGLTKTRAECGDCPAEG